MKKEVKIEGYSPEEILKFSDEEIEGFVFCDKPIVLRAGTSEVLGEFRINKYILEVELAQIDGGGEGVIPTIWALSERYARKRNLKVVDWIVHALTCAKPNLKLRRVLEKKGFQKKVVRGVEVLYYRNNLD